ncbi:hypothetical protein O1L68_24710 [Streptomyces lydicus]|nr:hypothetical protein [Streptomyces lydicus]
MTTRCTQRNCRRRLTSPGASGRASSHLFASGLVHSRTTGSFTASRTPRRPMYQGRCSPPGSSGASTREKTSDSSPSPSYASARASASIRLAMLSLPLADAVAADAPLIWASRAR